MSSYGQGIDILQCLQKTSRARRNFCGERTKFSIKNFVGFVFLQDLKSKRRGIEVVIV